MIQLRFPGGYRKALTLSYDDGVDQDRKLIELLDAAGIACTFNLNSGLFPPEDITYPAGQIHRRLPEKKVRALYDTSRHEVAVHCLTHASLPELPVDQMIHEIHQDRLNLESLFGTMVRGAAYPYGTFDSRAVEALSQCGIEYCRTVISSHRFDLPRDFLRLEATCHHNDPELFRLCDDFRRDTSDHPLLFYLWGHSYEFEAHNNWERIEQFCREMGGLPDVWYATNLQICLYIKAFRALVYSADGKRIHNPTCMKLCFSDGQTTREIAPGETLMI
ncbi:MAG: polysaccharide deacetylase family protein [Clostridia bacterium]|nr:polysaccharide deacetylase family protein [Clostridia bacterium]